MATETRLDYEWQLTHHLLPFFAGHRLSQITTGEVDRYMAVKVREAARYAEACAAWQKLMDEASDKRREELRRKRPPTAISAVSINKTLMRLSQILDRAVRYGLIDKNPARDKEARLKVSKPSPVWLDRAEHIGALLDAAGQLDARARREHEHIPRRAMLATLVLAGLRIGELLDLRWRDVDLIAGRITVRQSKTDAGVRQVDILPLLRAILGTGPRRGPDQLVFPTTTGARHGPSNIRRRVLGAAVKLANERLEQDGEVPLPEHLTPHKLRHTFASLLVALGVDVGSVMDQLGRTEAGFTLRVYRHGMRRDQASRDALSELVGLTDRAAAGSNVVPVQFAAVAGAR